MSSLEVNIVSAVAIGIIIATMAAVKSSRLKALIYSLPIPITLALIATGGHVNVTHIIGLVLVTLFLWTVKALHGRRWNIYISDAIATILYITVGYISIEYLKISFFVAAIVYIILWMMFIILYKNHPPTRHKAAGSTIAPIKKLPIVAVFAFILLNLKSYLSGVIVTFPFSGVFAVIEGRHILATLASTFTRNSLAILAMFITIYMLGDTDMFIKLAIGWVVYVVVLRAIIRAYKE